MKSTLKFIVSRFIRPLVRRYVSRPTNYHYDQLSIVVLPGVFHPRFFFSTKLLLRCLKKMDLKNKTLLELGAGSGLISLFSALNGAVVTATDISEVSCKNIKENQIKNHLFFPVIHSDLFNEIPKQTFDMIVINPPYFKKNPVTEADHAWYCGENGEYFVKLFSSIGNYIHKDSRVMMVLADVCDIAQIKSIAAVNNFEFELLSEHNFLFEKNYIFEIRSTN